MILLLAGCVGKLPFINEPPVLISVNGVASVPRQNSVVLPPLEPGAVIELEIEAEDPEGDRFGVWFPSALGTVNFDPAERSGTIELPKNSNTSSLQLALRDERDPPVASFYIVFFGDSYGYGYTTSYTVESADTGDSGL